MTPAFAPPAAEQGVARRSVLIGMSVAGGLAVGYALWPRTYRPNLVAAPGETIFNPWLKIGRDGHVTVIVPQVEMGQGSYTALPQILADELGADWRTIAVEPAPVNPAYDNALLADEWRGRWLPGPPLQVTGEASSIRAFEAPMRRAGAAARVLLCMAAAKRWDADWRACDTAEGFVVRGDDRLRFGALAEEAAGFAPPDEIPLRMGSASRITGHGVSRLDGPAKLDGSANYAADIRLPDMVFASIRQGPPGDSRLLKVDVAAAEKIAGVIQVVQDERWVAAVATNWWAANRALDSMSPRFSTAGKIADDKSIAKALKAAFEGEGNRIAETGDADKMLAGAKLVRAEYAVGFSPHAALEPVCASAQFHDGALELWIPTHWPGVARSVAANAIGIGQDRVTIHATPVGGSFGRKYEVEVAAQAALLAQKIGRPVQLCWSRTEDFWQDRMRPAAAARMAARLGAGGRVEAWRSNIAAPDGLGAMIERNLGRRIRSAATDGAGPPYALANFALDHHALDLGLPVGQWRGGAHGLSAFFTESFADELATESGIEPFSFRMAMLGGNTRLALCLSKVVTQGNWQGGAAGSGQGIACHAMRGSHVAVLAEAHLGDDQRVKVTKLSCVADIGRVINPDLARQQIEGGLLFGMAAATGNAISVRRGLPGPARLGALGLPRLADMPEIEVELIVSNAASGGVSDIAVPPVAPAIANALFAGTGRRFRSLPLVAETA